MTLEKFKKGVIWFLKSFLWLIPLLFVLDIISKQVFQAILKTPGNSIVVIPYVFSFTLIYNQGAAWGIFSGMDWLLITISVVCGVGLSAFFIWKYKKLPKHIKVAFMLFIPGAFGNLIDRAFFPKGVIDFLEFTFIDFPVFNFADSYLVIGVFILLIGEVVYEFGNRKKKKTEKTEEDPLKKIQHEKIEKVEIEEKNIEEQSIDDDGRKD